MSSEEDWNFEESDEKLIDHDAEREEEDDDEEEDGEDVPASATVPAYDDDDDDDDDDDEEEDEEEEDVVEEVEEGEDDEEGEEDGDGDDDGEEEQEDGDEEDDESSAVAGPSTAAAAPKTSFRLTDIAKQAGGELYGRRDEEDAFMETYATQPPGSGRTEAAGARASDMRRRKRRRLTSANKALRARLDKYFLEGDYGNALETARELVIAQQNGGSGSGETFDMMGNVFLHMSDDREAQQCYYMAGCLHKNRSSSAASFRNAADAAFRLNDPVLLEECLRRSVKQKRDTTALTDLGAIQFKLGMLKNARRSNLTAMRMLKEAHEEYVANPEQAENPPMDDDGNVLSVEQAEKHFTYCRAFVTKQLLEVLQAEEDWVGIAEIMQNDLVPDLTPAFDLFGLNQFIEILLLAGYHDNALAVVHDLVRGDWDQASSLDIYPRAFISLVRTLDELDPTDAPPGMTDPRAVASRLLTDVTESEFAQLESGVPIEDLSLFEIAEFHTQQRAFESAAEILDRMPDTESVLFHRACLRFFSASEPAAPPEALAEAIEAGERFVDIVRAILLDMCTNEAAVDTEDTVAVAAEAQKAISSPHEREVYEERLLNLKQTFKNLQELYSLDQNAEMSVAMSRLSRALTHGTKEGTRRTGGRAGGRAGGRGKKTSVQEISDERRFELSAVVEEGLAMLDTGRDDAAIDLLIEPVTLQDTIGALSQSLGSDEAAADVVVRFAEALEATGRLDEWSPSPNFATRFADARESARMHRLLANLELKGGRIDSAAKYIRLALLGEGEAVDDATILVMTAVILRTVPSSPAGKLMRKVLNESLAKTGHPALVTLRAHLHFLERPTSASESKSASESDPNTRALPLYTRALGLLTDGPPPPAMLLCLGLTNLGAATARTGKHKANRALHLVAAFSFLTAHEAAVDSALLAEAQYNVARAYDAAGMRTHAVAKYEEAISTADDSDDAVIRAMASHNLARIFFLIDNPHLSNEMTPTL